MRKLNLPVICKDGFKMSIQANDAAYCDPRVIGADRYIAVEIGFPNQSEEMILEYADDQGAPTDTVYAYVPASLVSLVIAKHGGIVEGELPAGIPYLRAD